jgi:hypothetical protein
MAKHLGNKDIKESLAVGFNTTTPTYTTARLQVRGTGSTSATSTLLAENSAGVDLFKIDDDGDISAVPTIGELNIGNVAVTGSLINARGRGNTDATKILDFRNSSGNQIMQISDTANMVIGVGNYLTNSRLYVHAINTNIQYGLNTRIASTRAGSVWNQVEVNAQTAGAAAYNYFNAISNGNIARALWGNSQGGNALTNVGVYSFAQSAVNNNYAFNGQVSGAVNPTGADYGMYLRLNGSATDDKFGVDVSLENGAANGNRTGYRVISSAVNTGVTTTGINIDLNGVAIASQTQVGISIDVTGTGVGTTNRAINTVGGDVRLGYLAGTGTRFVQTDATGILSAEDVPTFTVYTVATLPSAATYTNGVIIVSDEVGGRTLATSDGTNWLRVSDGAIVA